MLICGWLEEKIVIVELVWASVGGHEVQFTSLDFRMPCLNFKRFDMSRHFCCHLKNWIIKYPVFKVTN